MKRDGEPGAIHNLDLSALYFQDHDSMRGMNKDKIGFSISLPASSKGLPLDGVMYAPLTIQCGKGVPRLEL